MFLLALAGAALVVYSAGAANSSGTAFSTLLQPNGKVVVGGAGAYGGQGSFGLARYSAAGKLDAHFGLGGRAVTPVGENSQTASVALQADGKIVAAGFTSARAHTSGFHSSFALVRYRTNGSVDRSFGTNGRVTTKFGRFSGAAAVAVQSDGRIVAAGSNGNLALARYQPGGRLDSSFGTSGRTVTAVGSSANASAIALQADGKILLAGTSANGDVVVARYAADGTLDPSFGSGGIVQTGFGGRPAAAGAIALQPDGKIVVAGDIGTGIAGDPGYQFLLVRYDADGILDSSFGSGGVVMTSFTDITSADLPWGGIANALALQPDGKIIAGGAELMPWPGRGAFALARYNANGSLDSSFGDGGTLTTSFGYGSPENPTEDGDSIRGLAIQPDGRIVAAGYSQFGPHTEQYAVALARYTPDGTLDSSFGTAGKVKTSLALCVVPKLRGVKMDWFAQQRIKGSQCAVGKITRVHSRTVERRRVISERPRPGTVHLAGTKVRVVVSLGRR